MIAFRPLQQKRLCAIVLLLVVVSSGVGLVLYALQQNINLFFTPTQVKRGEALRPGQVFRVGGLVRTGSVVREDKTLRVKFILTDLATDLSVSYQGILPDLFREGQGVVAQGRLTPAGDFVAEEVLAKHDEKYMPPQVARTLARTQPQKAV